jgi:hypothetical protein
MEATLSDPTSSGEEFDPSSNPMLDELKKKSQVIIKVGKL